jgi:hypothetical protein
VAKRGRACFCSQVRGVVEMAWRAAAVGGNRNQGRCGVLRLWPSSLRAGAVWEQGKSSGGFCAGEQIGAGAGGRWQAEEGGSLAVLGVGEVAKLAMEGRAGGAW